MKHFAICLVCALLYPIVVVEERRARRQRELDDALTLTRHVAATLPKQGRVAAWIFPTAHGTQTGWRVRASHPQEAAEIMSQSPVFGGVI